MIIAVSDPFLRTVFYILSAVFGLCAGSFLNVVIYRLPRKIGLAFPPSYCPKCGTPIKFYDNIPLLSYIILRGRCRSCRGRISPRYALVEFFNALLWLLCAAVFASNVIYAVISMLVCSVCICVFFIDLENMIIPDRFQIVLAALALLSVFFDTFCGWKSHLAGLAAAALLFFPLGYIVSRKTGREALGGGDIKFALSAGLLLGWSRFLLMILLASVPACVVMWIKKKKEGVSRERPFAPFLTAALALSLLAGAPVVDWYISLLTL